MRNPVTYIMNRIDIRSRLLVQYALCALLAATAMGSSAQQAPQNPIQDIGTLFTTPDEREYLDFLRRDFVTRSQLATFNIQEDVIPDIPVPAETESEAPEVTQYRFGGVMTRINGNRMVWLNGQQTAERDLPGNLSLATQAGLTVLLINSNGTTYQLKPGQSINLQAGQVSESRQDAAATNSNEDTATSTSNANTAEPDVDTEAPQTSDTIMAEETSDLEVVLQQLETGNEELTDEELTEEQRQQALDILTEQIE